MTDKKLLRVFDTVDLMFSAVLRQSATKRNLGERAKDLEELQGLHAQFKEARLDWEQTAAP